MNTRPRRITIIMGGLAAFLIGLAIARLRVNVAWQLVLPFIFVSILAYKISRKVFALVIIASCLLAGLCRGQVFISQLDKYESVYKQKVTLVAKATEDGIYAEQNQLAFSVDSIKVVEPTKQDLVGNLKVEGFGVPMVYRGDLIQISGKIYPTRGGKQGTIKFAQIKVIAHHENLIEKVRHNFIAGMYNALPEPLASFALGLLIGQRSTLPKATAAALTAAGLTHIIAVSGYNLTIIARSVQRLLAKSSRYQTVIISLSLVALFVLLAGSSPSIMRASLVSFISLIAWYYGRNLKPVLLILLVAVITAGLNPVYLWSDIGWYLSFLAFFGVLVIAPLVVKRVYQHKKPKIFGLVCIETISAQIMTIPIILFVFGRTSWLSIFANLLVVPFVPFAMFLALIAGIFGMWLPAFSGLAALPAKIILTYMLDVASFFAKLPGVVIEKSISQVQMICMYVILMLLTTLLWHKNRDKNVTIDPL